MPFFENPSPPTIDANLITNNIHNLNNRPRRSQSILKHAVGNDREGTFLMDDDGRRKDFPPHPNHARSIDSKFFVLSINRESRFGPKESLTWGFRIGSAHWTGCRFSIKKSADDSHFLFGFNRFEREKKKCFTELQHPRTRYSYVFVLVIPN